MDSLTPTQRDRGLQRLRRLTFGATAGGLIALAAGFLTRPVTLAVAVGLAAVGLASAGVVAAGLVTAGVVAIGVRAAGGGGAPAAGALACSGLRPLLEAVGKLRERWPKVWD